MVNRKTIIPIDKSLISSGIVQRVLLAHKNTPNELSTIERNFRES